MYKTKGNDEVQQVLKPLYGVTRSNVFPDYYQMVHYGELRHPHSYLVKIVLTLLCQNRLPPGGDKSDWAAAVQFNGNTWVIADRKRFAWNVYGPSDQESGSQKLIKKIVSSARLTNKFLKKVAKESFDKDKLALSGVGFKINRLYENFRELSEKKIEEIKNFDLRKKSPAPPKGVLGGPIWTDAINELVILRHNLEAFTVSAVIFFFSYTESIFDVCFSLLDRKSLSFKDFSQLSWAEKYKMFIAPDQTYEALCRIRTYHRNPMTHSESVKYFPLRHFGLIPFDHDDLDKPINKNFHSIDELEAKKIFSTFDTFIENLNHHPSCQYVMAYLEHSLPVYIDNDILSDLKTHMTDIEEFRAELQRRSNLEDAYINMEI